MSPPPELLAPVNAQLGAGQGWKPHRHRREDELVIVLSGCVRVRHGRHLRHDVDAGKGLLLPRGRPHEVVALAASHVLTVLSPSGFEDVHDRLRQAGDPAQLEALIALAAHHGCDLVAPWPPDQHTQ